MKYIVEYDVCRYCQKAIHQCANMIAAGLAGDQYASDPEGPSMMAHDLSLTCSSRGLFCSANPVCYYNDAVCTEEVWQCQSCREHYCTYHGHVTSLGPNVECVACERERITKAVKNI